MGLSDVIAAGITVIALMVTGYLVIAGVSSAADTAVASLATARDSADARLHTALALEAVDASALYLDFNLTNLGKTTVGNLQELDVFVKTIEAGRVTGCRWLPYSATPAGDDGYWYVLERPGASGSDPGSLEPGATITVRCMYQSPGFCDGALEVSAPDGSSATGYYRIRSG